MVCCVLPEVPRSVTVYVPAGVPLLPLCLVVEIVRLDVAEVLPGVTEDGENEQLVAFGSPEEQLSPTDELKVPPRALTVTV
jgi:hypothetical protein